jgi:putative ABC transport system ATP-binding protein
MLTSGAQDLQPERGFAKIAGMETGRDPHLVVRGLTKVYEAAKIRVIALKEVSLELRGGAFAAVTGASGSGKSTLLNLIGGLDTPTSGSIEVQGRAISELNKEELALFRRFGVGMIFQSFNLIPSLTAVENVGLPMMFSGVSRRERRAKAAAGLARVGLEARLRHRPSELSGGEQQRVAIARALVNNPRLLLADEPTGNLDSRTAQEIIALLAELNQRHGLTVVMVTHEETLVREFATGIVRLHDGQIAAEEWRR